VLNAQSNFSVPLSAASIISKFSSAELSCNAENALVTFDGQSLRALDDQGKGFDLGGDGSSALAAAAGDAANDGLTLTLLPGIDATITLKVPIGTGHIFATTFTITPSPSATSPPEYPTIDPPLPSTTSSNTSPTTTSPTVTPTKSSSTTAAAQPTGTFAVTDQVFDFARVAVLFVLQERSVIEASLAQNLLQTFLHGTNSNTTPDQARNITIGNSNSVDLIDLFVDVGAGKVGGVRSNT
jgi:hypothetical protein